MPSVKRIRIAEEKPPTAPEPSAPLSRITRLMALAIWFDELIRTGEVETYAELARIGGVSRARVTQIMDLLNLAPVIQNVLLWPGSRAARLSERAHRSVTTSDAWATQRSKWPRLLQKQRADLAAQDTGRYPRLLRAGTSGSRTEEQDASLLGGTGAVLPNH